MRSGRPRSGTVGSLLCAVDGTRADLRPPVRLRVNSRNDNCRTRIDSPALTDQPGLGPTGPPSRRPATRPASTTSSSRPPSYPSVPALELRDRRDCEGQGRRASRVQGTALAPPSHGPDGVGEVSPSSNQQDDDDGPARSSPHAHGPSEIWKRADVRASIDQARAFVASRARSRREARGRTQEEAPEKAGLHAKHVSAHRTRSCERHAGDARPPSPSPTG